MRLIDADRLLFMMFHYYDCVNENTEKAGYKGETLMDYEVAGMIDDCIENAPTVDAAPVAHGEWIDESIRFVGDLELSKCSICGRKVSTMWGRSNYCPNCGAKMDGGTE